MTAPVSPSAWRLVPVEPTEAMFAAALATNEPFHPCAVWEAMLAASPVSPSAPVAWGYAYRRRSFEDGIPLEDAPWNLHREDDGFLMMLKADPEHWEVQALALAASPAPSMVGLTRPIVGIENRTAQEVFDIMSDRIRLALLAREGE